MGTPGPRRLSVPRVAVDAEVDELAASTVHVALTGRRGRPLHELMLEGSGDRVLCAFRTREVLDEAAESFDLRTTEGTLKAVEVEGVHALAHVHAARLAGLVIDPGAMGSALVPMTAARDAVARASGTPSIPPPPPVRPPSTPTIEDQAPRVVVVDDDPLVLRSLERFLTGRGATVFTVVSSLEAAAMTMLQRPTVLVLDVMMPGMDGERVWGLLGRATTRPPNVVFYSGIGARELASIARGDPRVERVTKESEPQELWEAVARAHARSVAPPAR